MEEDKTEERANIMGNPLGTESTQRGGRRRRPCKKEERVGSGRRRTQIK